MPGVRQKPPARLSFRRNGRGAGLNAVARTQRVPPAPSTFGPVALATWRRIWHHEVAAIFEYDVDGPQIRHYCECVEERDQLVADLKAEGVEVHDADGKPRPNLKERRLRYLDHEIDKIGNQFGLTPQSRFRLDVKVTEPKPLPQLREVPPPATSDSADDDDDEEEIEEF